MKEIWDLAISPAMLPLSILLVPVAIYWLFSIIGAAGHGSHGHHHGGGGHHDGGGHHHFGGSHHHGHAGAHGHSHAGGHHGHGPQGHHGNGHHGHHDAGGHHFVADLIHGVLRVMNAEDVPLMLVLSVLIVFLWGGAMLGNLWFSHSTSWAPALIPFVSLLFAIVITRVAMIPLKPVFRLIQKDADLEVPMMGRSGYVRTASVDPDGGQVVIENRGSPIIVGARTTPEGEPILRNTKILVIGRDDDTGLYIVRPLNEILPSV